MDKFLRLLTLRLGDSSSILPRWVNLEEVALPSRMQRVEALVNIPPIAQGSREKDSCFAVAMHKLL